MKSNQDRSPHLLIVNFSARGSGPSYSLLKLLDHWGDRYRVTVAVPGKGELPDELDRRGIPVVNAGRFGYRSPALPWLVWTLSRGNYDLVYANSFFLGARNACIASKLLGLPFVWHLREILTRRQWKTASFLRLADAIVAVSHASAEAAKPYVGSRPLHVIHNGIDSEDFQGDRESARSRLAALCGASDEDKIIVSIGHICERKSQEDLVLATDLVRKHFPKARVLIFGAFDRDPKYVSRIRRLIGETGLERIVFLPGFLELADLLPGADIMVHTARRDPNPRAVIEAMAAGLPVVAYSVDGVPEVVQADETGLLVNPGDTDPLADAIVRLLKDGNERNRMGSTGRKRVLENFSAETTAVKVGGVIDRVLSDHGEK